MLKDNFTQRKKAILSKGDKSSIGKWDEKIVPLCDKINSLENFYTTSSCSGRVSLMINQEKKGKGLFIAVYHDKISFEQLSEKLTLASRESKPIKFKLDPCILHVACKTLEDAEKLYNLAKLAGWKKSGVIGLKNGFTLELNSSERLEFPIMQKNKILVKSDFLEVVVKECNAKLEKSWRKIKKLDSLLNQNIFK